VTRSRTRCGERRHLGTVQDTGEHNVIAVVVDHRLKTFEVAITSDDD